MSKHQYLVRHGNQWRVQKKVPLHLRAILGKAKLVRPLHTDSLVQANRLKWMVLQEFDAIIQAAEAEARRRAGVADPVVAEALEFKRAMSAAIENPDEYEEYDDEGNVAADAPMLIKSLIEDRSEEIAEKLGQRAAASFYGIATGTETPLLMLVDDWLAEKPMKPRQKIDYRRAVSKFAAWLSTNKQPVGVEAITRKIAGQYVSKAFVAMGTHPKTTNKDISCLSSYWKWLSAKGYAEDNVWRGQSVTERAKSKDERKRPYTDDEMKVLLAGEPEAFVYDAMRIASLTGMRIEEIARLKVADVSKTTLEVRRAKTAAGERTVPIHPDLLSIIRQRCEGKGPDDFLFDELPTPKEGSAVERSQKVSKAFTAYRRRLGVDEVPEGDRQSRIDFHSFRRWFAAKAVQACNDGAKGFSQWTIAQVIGHSKADMPLAMTMRYAGDDTLAAMRACVEAVRLPRS